MEPAEKIGIEWRLEQQEQKKKFEFSFFTCEKFPENSPNILNNIDK